MNLKLLMFLKSNINYKLNKCRTNRANNNLRLQNSYCKDDKFGANSRTSLFIISGVKANVGEVLCINNEVSELLGYEKNEIVGHNISKVMPPIIAEKHSDLILNSFCSGKTVSQNDRMILPLHKQGYMIPCSFLCRIVPNLQNGLQLIGFIYKIRDFSEYFPILERNITPDEVVVLLTDETWMMLAFNIRASKMFGINPLQANLKKYINSEEKISVFKLVPQLEDPAFIDKIKSNSGEEVTLNLNSIRKVIEAEIEILKMNPITDGEEIGVGQKNEEIDFS